MKGCCEGELECPCPPVGMIDIVGKKWAVCLISLLGKYGVVRFGPIQQWLSTAAGISYGFGTVR